METIFLAIWKIIKTFFAEQILREINFEQFSNRQQMSQIVILATLPGQIYDYGEILKIFWAEIDQNQILSLKNCQFGTF